MHTDMGIKHKRERTIYGETLRAAAWERRVSNNFFPYLSLTMVSILCHVLDHVTQCKFARKLAL